MDYGASWPEQWPTSNLVELPELLPDFVQGWYLLHDSGLNSHEKNVVQTALQGDFSMSRVAQELRSQCANLDYAKKEFSYKNAGYLGDIPEEDSEAELGEDTEEDFNDDEKALWGEAEMEAQEAMAVVQQARNTLRQARKAVLQDQDRQRQVQVRCRPFPTSRRFQDDMPTLWQARPPSCQLPRSSIRGQDGRGHGGNILLHLLHGGSSSSGDRDHHGRGSATRESSD